MYLKYIISVVSEADQRRYKMTNKEMDAKIIEMKNWEAEVAKINQIIEDIKSELKAECEARNEDEIRTDTFIVRYKNITSNRFNTSLFKKENLSLYNMYLKESITRKFTVD